MTGRTARRACATLAAGLALAAGDGLADGRRPPGAEGANRCTVYGGSTGSDREVVVYSGRVRKEFAICIDRRDPQQQVTVTLDRRRTVAFGGSADRQTCRDVSGRHVRLVFTRPGPTVSSCPAL